MVCHDIVCVETILRVCSKCLEELNPNQIKTQKVQFSPNPDLYPMASTPINQELYYQFIEINRMRLSAYKVLQWGQGN